MMKWYLRVIYNNASGWHYSVLVSIVTPCYRIFDVNQHRGLSLAFSNVNMLLEILGCERGTKKLISNWTTSSGWRGKCSRLFETDCKAQKGTRDILEELLNQAIVKVLTGFDIIAWSCCTQPPFETWFHLYNSLSLILQTNVWDHVNFESKMNLYWQDNRKNNAVCPGVSMLCLFISVNINVGNSASAG
jgi:hypothetical protein